MLEAQRSSAPSQPRRIPSPQRRSPGRFEKCLEDESRPGKRRQFCANLSRGSRCAWIRRGPGRILRDGICGGEEVPKVREILDEMPIRQIEVRGLNNPDLTQSLDLPGEKDKSASGLTKLGGAGRPKARTLGVAIGSLRLVRSRPDELPAAQPHQGFSHDRTWEELARSRQSLSKRLDSLARARRQCFSSTKTWEELAESRQELFTRLDALRGAFEEK